MEPTSPPQQTARPSRCRAGFLLGLIVGLIAGVLAGYPLWASLRIAPTADRDSVRDVAAAEAALHPWAEQISPPPPGLRNLYKVSDDLYRGEQPEAEGFAELKKMGIKTVVNLRALHGESDEAAAAGLDYEHIRTEAYDMDDHEVVAFLKVVADPARRPVFVHCQHGSDRTGTMCAAYRIVVQGWSKQEAIDEMTRGGFGFHETWENLVRYVNKLDVEKIRRQAGLAE